MKTGLKMEDILRAGIENGMSYEQLIGTARRSISEILGKNVNKHDERFATSLALADFCVFMENEIRHCGRPVLSRIIWDLEVSKVGIRICCASCMEEKMYWEESGS